METKLSRFDHEAFGPVGEYMTHLMSWPYLSLILFVFYFANFSLICFQPAPFVMTGYARCLHCYSKRWRQQNCKVTFALVYQLMCLQKVELANQPTPNGIRIRLHTMLFYEWIAWWGTWIFLLYLPWNFTCSCMTIWWIRLTTKAV